MDLGKSSAAEQLAEEIRTELDDLRHERRHGSGHRDTKTACDKLREIAATGLTAAVPNVAKAAENLRQLQTEWPTHRIIPSGEGEPFFDLELRAAVKIDHFPAADELARRIKKELQDLLFERREGGGHRDTNAILEKLRQVAEKGLTNDKPDVQKANSDLNTIQGAFATYELREETRDDALWRGPGFLTLAKIEDVQVSPDAQALAEAINSELRRLHGRAGDDGTKRLKTLIDIAKIGLTNDNPDVERARDELRKAGLRYPVVRATGEDDFTMELDPGTTEEQRNFITKFDHAFNLVRQLHKGRGVPVFSELLVPFVRWIVRALARVILHPIVSWRDLSRWAQNLRYDHQTSTPPSSPVNEQWDRKDFEEARTALVNAARFALPDRGAGYVADVTMGTALVNRIVADAIREHGPKARRDYLLDLLLACVVTIAIVGGLTLVVFLCWPSPPKGDPSAWQGVPSPGLLAYAMIAVGFLFVGAWLSAAQRITSSENAVVENLFAQPLDSLLRAGVLLGWAVLVLLLLYKKVLVVNLGSEDGGLTTTTMFQKLSSAIFFGALLGLSERALPNVLGKQAEDFAKKLGGKDSFAEGTGEAPATQKTNGKSS